MLSGLACLGLSQAVRDIATKAAASNENFIM